MVVWRSTKEVIHEMMLGGYIAENVLYVGGTVGGEDRVANVGIV